MADAPLELPMNPVEGRAPATYERNRWGHYLSNPVHTERRIRIIVIGAGASGLLFAYKLQRSFRNYELAVYEKDADITGTWFENRYPGCACDIPAHAYTWSFEPNPNWSSVYATSPEIYEYFRSFSEKYGLGKYCKTNHEVTGAWWNENRGGWQVEVTDHTDKENPKVINDCCDILINASGILNAWRWPDIPGLNKFKGPMLHSARWDNSVELAGKNVGLIGNGSSAIQILPAIQPHVKKLTTFIRGATWVSPAQGMEQHHFTEEEKRKFRDEPKVLREYRQQLERAGNAIFGLFIRNSKLQRAVAETMTTAMKGKLENPELEKKLIPKWPVGCRRLTPGVNYLESLSKENVEVYVGAVTEITEKGVRVDNGKEYPLDVLICATGFDTSFKPRFPIVGRNGHNLQDVWKDEAKSYLGVAAPEMPNYFCSLGPNCPIGNGPVLIAMEDEADYMLRFIDRYQTENIHSFIPKQEAIDDFVEHKDKIMSNTVWEEDCRSWYKANSVSGKVSALWPGSTLHHKEVMMYPRYDDWNIRYKGNRFAWMGNGFSQTEIDETANWGYYMRDEDESPYLSKRKQLWALNESGTRKPDEDMPLFGGINRERESKL